MENAEGISLRSVEATENAQRPFLLVQKVIARISHAEYESDAALQYRHNIYFDIVLKNFGGSPADIVGYTADADMFDPPRAPTFYDTPPAYGEESKLNDSIVGTNEEVPDRIKASLSLTDREYSLCTADEKRVTVFGRLRYRGSSPKVFETLFYYGWFACDPDMPPIRCNTKKWNDPHLIQNTGPVTHNLPADG